MNFTAKNFTTIYVCSICGKSFKRNEHLKTHQSSVHEKVKVECNFCKKKMHPSAYKRHVKYACKNQTVNQDYAKSGDGVECLNEEYLL